jgi:hypothetical protein
MRSSLDRFVTYECDDVALMKITYSESTHFSAFYTTSKLQDMSKSVGVKNPWSVRKTMYMEKRVE